jgi:hypothetical protein
MRLAARKRIIGGVALALTAAALAPGTSGGYRLMSAGASGFLLKPRGPRS